MANNDPSQHCYIIVLPDEGEDSSARYEIRFQTMPDKITDRKSAVFNDAQIIGRSSPLKTYQFSSARRISLNLEFFASLEANDVSDPSMLGGVTKVKETVNLLRALVNPNYGNKLIARPRKCILRVGDNIGMIGFCLTVNVTLRGDYPWELNPAMAHYASVAMTFEETGEDVYSFDDIRIGKDASESAALGMGFSVTTAPSIGETITTVGGV